MSTYKNLKDNDLMKNLVTDEYRTIFVKWICSLKEWEWWFTGTFRYECALEPAKRAFRRFVKREMGKGVSYIYVCESNCGRSGYHIHALFADCEGIRRKRIWKKWFDRYGRARILPVDPAKGLGTQYYLSKYLSKDFSDTGPNPEFGKKLPQPTDWNIHLKEDQEWLNYQK